MLIGFLLAAIVSLAISSLSARIILVQATSLLAFPSFYLLAKHYITSRQDAPGYYFSSELIRPFKNDLLLRLLFGITDDLSAMYVTDQDLRYDSQYHRLGFSYRLYPGLVSEIYAEWFKGEYASYVGQWRDNDRIVVLLRWTL